MIGIIWHVRNYSLPDSKINKKPEIKKIEVSKLIIVIQPFKGFPTNNLNYFANELKKIYSKVVVNKPIELPVSSLSMSKTKYRADTLIKFLNNKTAKGYLTIGLVKNDICMNKNGVKEWGIFGLGYCPGKSCVVSIFRLKGENKVKKLFKVAIHELGHTQGLKHCPVLTCLMRDAKGKDCLDQEKEFCPKCKNYLLKSGWIFKL